MKKQTGIAFRCVFGLLLIVVLLTVMLASCSHSDMRSWVHQNYGFIVSYRVVTLAWDVISSHAAVSLL